MILYPKRDGLLATGAFVIGLLLAAWLLRGPGEGALRVTFINAGEEPIQSLTVNHGSADLQETITLLRLAPGERRRIHLNKEPGLGYDVTALYTDGHETAFCANAGVDSRHQRVTFHR
ncbi:MAG: hypothetical protein ACQERR_02805 [Pseudomonadota bacterium]